jgi:hypothetical protein
MPIGATNWAGPSPVGGNSGNSMALLAQRLFGMGGGPTQYGSPAAERGMAEFLGLPGAQPQPQQGRAEPGMAPGQQWLDRINARQEGPRQDAAMARYQQWLQQRGGGGAPQQGGMARPAVMPQQSMSNAAMGGPAQGGGFRLPQQQFGGGMGMPQSFGPQANMGAPQSFNVGANMGAWGGWQPQGLGLGGGMPGGFGMGTPGAAPGAPVQAPVTIPQPPPPPAGPQPPPMSNLPMPSQPVRPQQPRVPQQFFNPGAVRNLPVEDEAASPWRRNIDRMAALRAAGGR